MTDEEKKEYCWNHAKVVNGYDKDTIRKDACGAWIFKEHYGLKDSEFGWEIDHVLPVIMGWDDFEQNLRALHCKNNESKGDDYPVYESVMRASGIKNIEVVGLCYCTVNENLQQILNDYYNKSKTNNKQSNQ